LKEFTIQYTIAGTDGYDAFMEGAEQTIINLLENNRQSN